MEQNTESRKEKREIARGKRGFTLIETFVAITILLTAIAGPLTLSSKGLTSAILARDQLTASFLAQEGLEYVHHKRDTNHLRGNSWLAGLDNCINQNCTVDSVTDSVPQACTTSCEPMHFDDSSGFYGYNAATPQTLFTRTVKITQLASGYEAQVDVTINWRTGIFTRQFVLSEVLTNWQ